MDSWHMRIQEWRSEAVARSNNNTAEQILAQIEPNRLKAELRHYLSALYNTQGENILQPQRVEGPEHYPVLLHTVEVLKRYKARIRSIVLDAKDYKATAGQLLGTIERTLQFRPEFLELKTAEQRKSVIRMVGRELVELQDALDPIIEMGTEIGKEYSDAFNAAALEYNIVNAMSYQRGLYAGPGLGAAPTPQNTTIRR